MKKESKEELLRDLKLIISKFIGPDQSNWPQETFDFIGCLMNPHSGRPRHSKKRPLPNVKPSDVWTPSPEQVLEHRSARGGWTRLKLTEWGIPWPPPNGWRRHLEQKWKAEKFPGVSEK